MHISVSISLLEAPLPFTVHYMMTKNNSSQTCFKMYRFLMKEKLEHTTLLFPKYFFIRSSSLTNT